MVLALVVTLAPPTILLLLTLPLVRAEAAWNALLAGFVGLLSAVIALEALGAVADGPGLLLIAAAIALGAVAGVAYFRADALRGALTVLSPVPALVLLLFLVFSPVSDLVWGDDDAARASGTVAGDTPVVFLIFDEMSLASILDRHEEIDASRYPNLARLARHATWYRGATTVADETAQAVPAILTGKRPERGLLPTSADHPDNLFTLLGGSYRMHVSESVTRLCPDSLCHQARASTGERLDSLASDLGAVGLHLLLPEDYESDLPAVDRTFSGFGSDDDQGFRLGLGTGARDETFAEFLRGIRPGGERPALDFHHTQLPHVPWEYLPSGHRYPATREPDIPGAAPPPWSKQPVVTRESFRRYLAQVGEVDRLVGATVRRLRETGLYDRSLIVLSSDHGVSFRPGQPRRLIEERNFADLAGVPMIVKAPGQRAGRTIDTPALTVDILPTLAAMLGTKVPWQVDGRSLTAGPRPASSTLRIDSFDGDVLHSGFEEYRRELRAATARELALGASGGPLYGRLAADLAAAAPEAAEVQYDDPGRYTAVDPASGVVPAFVTGRLSGGARAGLRLAVLVNGRICAVTEAYSDNGEVGFGALVPEGSLRPGRNRVEVRALRGTPGAPALAKFASSERRLVEEDGKTYLESPSGARVEVRPGAVQGFVETAGTVGDRVVVAQGWAADTKRKQPAERVLLFADGRLLADEPPSKPRSDLVKLHGPALRRAGFVIGGAGARGEKPPSPGSLRVIAVIGDRASELRRLSDAGR